jgi:serine/threonine protein kinase
MQPMQEMHPMINFEMMPNSPTFEVMPNSPHYEQMNVAQHGYPHMHQPPAGEATKHFHDMSSSGSVPAMPAMGYHEMSSMQRSPARMSNRFRDVPSSGSVPAQVYLEMASSNSVPGVQPQHYQDQPSMHVVMPTQLVQREQLLELSSTSIPSLASKQNYKEHPSAGSFVMPQSDHQGAVPGSASIDHPRMAQPGGHQLQPQNLQQQQQQQQQQQPAAAEALVGGSEVHLRDSYMNSEARTVDEWIVSCGRTTDTFHLLQKYSLNEIVKDDCLGLVAKASEKHKECRYVKQIHIHRKGGKLGLAEVPLLRKLEHPNVTGIWDVYSNARQGSEPDICYVVMDPMDGDLGYLIKQTASSLTEAHRLSLVGQLLEGLRYIHKKGIVHCGICPVNLLVTDDCDLRISNFYFACSTNNNPKSEERSSVPILAGAVTSESSSEIEKPAADGADAQSDQLCPPELWACSAPEILCKAENAKSGADVWSAGCVIVELYAGAAFVACDTKLDQMRRLIALVGWPEYPAMEITKEEIKELQANNPDFQSISVYLESLRKNKNLRGRWRDLLSKIFRLKTDKRESCDAILKHPFFESSRGR